MPPPPYNDQVDDSLQVVIREFNRRRWGDGERGEGWKCRGGEGLFEGGYFFPREGEKGALFKINAVKLGFPGFSFLFKNGGESNENIREGIYKTKKGCVKFFEKYGETKSDFRGSKHKSQHPPPPGKSQN